MTMAISEMRARAWSRGAVLVVAGSALVVALAGLALMGFRRDYVGHLLVGYGIAVLAASGWRRGGGAPIAGLAAAVICGFAFEFNELGARDAHDLAWTVVGGSVAATLWVTVDGLPHRRASIVGAVCVVVALVIRYTPGPGLP